MKHSFWDRYSDIKSPVHSIPPGIKIASTIFLITLLSVLPYKILILSIPPIFLFLIIIFAVSKIPLIFIIKRVLIIFPFLLPVIILNFFFTKEGIIVSIILTIRSILSIISVVILISVTKFRDILRTLSGWHLPKILILILSFMYRYFFLLTDESEKMVRSVKVRSGKRAKFSLIKVYAHILGILFIKSYERSDRVYKAMLIRGYNGEENIL